MPRTTTGSGHLRLAAAGAAVAWMVVIFSLSALPGSAVPGRFGSLGHFAVYAVLGSLYLAALDPTLRSPRAAAWAVALASAYGVTDEFHQLFVPGRKSDPIDWLVDTAGALFAVLLVRWAVRGNRGTGPEAPGTDTRETDAEVGGTAGAARPGG